MFIVKNKKGEVVLICTREEDAKAYLGASKIDEDDYTIEEKV
jgi:hypothetical protein